MIFLPAASTQASVLKVPSTLRARGHRISDSNLGCLCSGVCSSALMIQCLSLFSICHIFLFGITSLVHTRAVFKSPGCCFFFHIQFPLSDIAPLHHVYSCLLWRRCDHTAASNCHLYLERLHFIPVWPLHPGHSVISHPHFLQPRMSEIPHAFQCLHSGETW